MTNQPEGEEDGTSLDAAHDPLVLAVLLLERPLDGDLFTSEISPRRHRDS